MKLAAVGAFCVAAAGGELAVGSRVPDFVVTRGDGVEVTSTSLRAGSVTVVGFVAARCPVSNAYNQRLITLYREYSERGVRFVFVNSNSNETAAELAVHAKQAALVFPVYKDWKNRVADVFGAQTTPEMFVLDGDGVLRYHGAVDDSQNEARVRVKGLRMALDAVLAGRAVDPAQTRAFGCTLHRVRRGDS